MAQAKKIEDYRNRSRYVYPGDNINPELKSDRAWHLAYCTAMIADYASGNCQVPYQFDQGEYSFETLRKYATGQEGNAQVKKNFFGEKKRDPKTGLYPTTMNVSWNGTDIMPKFFDIMRAINQKIEYKSTARAIDTDSIQSKAQDREYVKFLVDDRTKSTLAMTGFKPNSPVNLDDIGAETESDVDLYFDTGGFLTQREIAAAAATQKTRKESDFKTIQDMIFDDDITLGVIGGKNYIDRANHMVLTRYVDPAKCVIPYSKYLDFRNITKCGEIRTMSIGELRKEFPHVTGAQWKILARDYAYMNPESTTELSKLGWFSNETGNKYGQDLINNCNVLVFDAQWLSEDTDTFLTNEKKEDSFFKPVKYGYEPSEKRKKTGDKTIAKNCVRKHFAAWVIGTEILLDYGVSEDVVYYGKDGNKVPGLDYFFNKTGNKSLVERCIPHIEDIHLAAVKLRNAIATLPPAPRMIVQSQLMDNVFLNGIKQQPEDLYQKFTEKGFLVVNNLDDFNKPIFQNAKAIEFVPANVIEDINIFRSEIAAGVDSIREVTGLNQTVDASTPDQYSGLGKSQMAATAANNALSPTFNAFVSFFSRLNNDVVKKWQIVAKSMKDLKIEWAPLGINTMQVLTIGEDFTNSDFGIYTEIEFTEDERRQLLAQIIELAQAYKASNGAAGLSTAEFIHLQDMIMAGNFQFAKYVLARTEKKREMNAARLKQQSEQFTFQSQQQSLMMNNKFKQEAITDEERKKLLTARITEVEKRITILYGKMTDTPAEGDGAPEPGSILALIKANEEAIKNMIIEDQTIDQQKAQAEQAQQQVA